MAIVPHGGGAGGLVSMAMPMLTPDNYTMWAIKAQAILDVHTVWEAVAPGDAAVNAKKCKTARVDPRSAAGGRVAAGGDEAHRQGGMGLPEGEVRRRRSGPCGEASDAAWGLRLKMSDGEALDAYAGKLAGMTTRFASLGETLGDVALVKKMLDTVPDRLFPVVAGIEQFCATATMAFDEALGRLRAFDERVRRHGQDGGERGGEQLLMTVAQWAARERRHGGAWDDHDGKSVASSSGGNRRRHCYKCGECGHFKRDCTKLRREPVAERALLTDVVSVEDDNLL